MPFKVKESLQEIPLGVVAQMEIDRALKIDELIVFFKKHVITYIITVVREISPEEIG